MKIKLLAIVLILFAESGYCQSLEKLRSDTKKLYAAFHDIDIEGITEMICTNGDTLAVKEQLDKWFLNDESKFRFVLTDAKYNISPIKKSDNKSFCEITFRNVIRITYFKLQSTEVLTQQKILKEKYNAQTITYDKTRNAFLIVYTAKLGAYADEGSAWKFIFYDNTVPESIIKNCFPDANKK